MKRGRLLSREFCAQAELHESVTQDLMILGRRRDMHKISGHRYATRFEIWRNTRRIKVSTLAHPADGGGNRIRNASGLLIKE